MCQSACTSTMKEAIPALPCQAAASLPQHGSHQVSIPEPTHLLSLSLTLVVPPSGTLSALDSLLQLLIELLSLSLQAIHNPLRHQNVQDTLYLFSVLEHRLLPSILRHESEPVISLHHPTQTRRHWSSIPRNLPLWLPCEDPHSVGPRLRGLGRCARECDWCADVHVWVMCMNLSKPGVPIFPVVEVCQDVPNLSGRSVDDDRCICPGCHDWPSLS